MGYIQNITLEKIQGFLVFKKNKGFKYNTLLAYIAAFSYYFRQNDLDTLTNVIEFKNFKNGLRLTMKGDICPNAKHLFGPQWFFVSVDMSHAGETIAQTFNKL